MRPPSGSLPWRNAWNSAGMSLRQVRSPVPPTTTRSNAMGGQDTMLRRAAAATTVAAERDEETIRMRSKAWAALAAGCLIGGTAAAQGQVNVICSVQADWCNLIQTVYAKTTGVKVNMS